MESIETIQAKRQERIQNIYNSISKGETDELIQEESLRALEKAGKITILSERGVHQLDIDLRKAEDTGFWKGIKVSNDDIQKAKEQAAKLQKKVVTDKSGGSKTVYIQVHDETKPHHKMTHEELMEHHTSEELHEIAENYRKTHEGVKESVDKHGAADDSFKSQKAEHSRKDVSNSEEMYMHIKQAAYKKEKVEEKAADKAKKDVNKPTQKKDDKEDVKKSDNIDIFKALEVLGVDTIEK